jgi:clan AA aspartic protease (TIGR02281 family)
MIAPALITYGLRAGKPMKQHTHGAATLSRFVVLLLLLSAPGSASAETIRLEMDGGTYLLPVQVNEAMSLTFVLDSGASDVAIPAGVADRLLRSGTVTQKDFVGTSTYMLADGSMLPSARFILHTVRIGNHVVRDVVASVGPAGGTLLLGQSFLSKLPSWTIDNAHHALILADESGAGGSPQIAAQRPPTTLVPPPPPPATPAPPQLAMAPSPGPAVPYPPHLASMLEPTDWPHVLTALTAAERSAPSQSIRWTNPLNGHEGFITRSDVGRDAEGCLQYRITRRSPGPFLLDFVDVCNGQIRR